MTDHAGPRRGRPGALLCIAQFPTNTGYAWDFIEGTFAELARRLAPDGIRTFVAYPEIAEPPRPLAGSPATPVPLPLDQGNWSSVRHVARFIRTERVEVVYLIDRVIITPAHWAFRAAGARAIIEHVHSSGDRSTPRGWLRLAKTIATRVPGLIPDRILTVSDFVAARTIRSTCAPATRIRRIWNGLPVPTGAALPRERPALLAGIPLDRPIVACACRAAADKGVDHLLRAFRLLIDRWPTGSPRPYLVYLGSGPVLHELRELASTLGLEPDTLLPGYSPEVRSVLAHSTVAVVPSVWQEALGLSVLEPLLVHRPVVASRVGGIPEVVRDRCEALLVPPGDAEAIAAAVRTVLNDRDLAARLAEAGYQRAITVFAATRMYDELEEEFRAAFRHPTAA